MKNLFLFLLLFTLSSSVVIDEINAQEAIDACVNSTNGNTRILAPYSNSVECRKSENPVSLSKHVGVVSKKVFVTSQQFSGYFVSEADSFAACADLEDGIEAADCICQELAESADPPLDGSYKAWLSDSEAINSPVVRFVKSIFPYVRVDGMIVAENWIDLTKCNEGQGGDECLDNPINIDENGDMIGDAPAWTNTKKDGKQINDDPEDTCFDWTTGPDPNTTNFAPTGGPNLKNIRWTNTITPLGNTTFNCPTHLHIYCFEQ